MKFYENEKLDVYQSYYNAYQLIVGDTTYVELARQGEFYLPKNHENVNMILKYFEDIKEYMKCHRISMTVNNLIK